MDELSPLADNATDAEFAEHQKDAIEICATITFCLGIIFVSFLFRNLFF